MKDVSAALDQLNEEGWGDTEERSFGDVGTGTFQVMIKKAIVGRAKSSGRLQVSWDFEVQNGKEKGRHIFMHRGLDTEDNRGRCRGELAKLGQEWPKDAKKLPGVLEDLEDTYAQVTRKDVSGYDEPFTNIDKAIKKADLDDTAGDEPDDEPPAKGEKAGKSEEKAEPAEAKFEADKLDKSHKKRIRALGESLKYDPDDYDDMLSLALDLADELKLSGEFDKPDDLVDELEDAAKDRK